MQDYFISIFYSEEDEGYIADIPDKPIPPPKYRPAIYQLAAPSAAAD